LASSERDKGDIDASLATLAEIAADEKGTFYAQWALLERSRLLTDLKRIDEAVADLDALIAVYPEGPLKDTADGELEDLDIERPTEVPAAPAPDVPTPEETRSTEAGE
jgi:predicted negative regulator of RcsB-dependent stress response